MAQAEFHSSDSLAIIAQTANTNQRRFFQVGHMLGTSVDVAVVGTNVLSEVQIRAQQSKVIAAEEWAMGQRIFWQGAGSVFTKLEQDAHVGWASRSFPDEKDAQNRSKKAGETNAEVAFALKDRDPDTIITIDFAEQAALGVIGTINLRDYLTEPAEAQFNDLVFVHDGNLTASTAVIELGTIADPNKIMTARAVSVLVALGSDPFEDIPVPLVSGVVQADQVTMTITVAAITAGILQFRLRNRKIGG